MHEENKYPHVNAGTAAFIILDGLPVLLLVFGIGMAGDDRWIAALVVLGIVLVIGSICFLFGYSIARDSTLLKWISSLLIIGVIVCYLCFTN